MLTSSQPVVVESPQSPVMLRLRDETTDLHKQAETKPFQLAFVRGQLTREQYIAWLGQMYVMHSELDAALKRAAEKSEPIRRVVTDEQYQSPYLREDRSLAYTGTRTQKGRTGFRRVPCTVETHGTGASTCRR